MKIKTSILSILFASLLITSCYLDKGNYDYTEISDIKITGIDAAYSKISAVDTLKINPVVESDYGDDMEYYWILFDAKLNADTIGIGRNLEYFVSNNLGTYNLFFYAKSKANGYYKHIVSKLNVGTIYTKGHYILKEDASGNTDMDLLLGDGRVVADILLNKHGNALQGKPRSMGLLYVKQYIDPDLLTRTYGHCLGVITESNKAKIYRASDMRELFDRSNMFFEYREDIPYKFLTIAGASLYLSSSGVTNVSASGSAGSGFFGFPTGLSGGSEYWAYSDYTSGLFYWDKELSRIMWTNSSAIADVLYDNNYPTTNLTDYDPQFIGVSRGSVYSLFKTKSYPQKLVMYKIVATSSWSLPYIGEVYDIDAASKMNGATLFAVNQNSAELLYFVNSNKLYYYNPINKTEQEISLPGIVAGETITFIANRHYSLAQPYFDYLTVATYNNGIYKVYMYNMVGGLPNGNPVVIGSGKGKVKETHFLGTYFDYIDLVMGYTYSR